MMLLGGVKHLQQVKLLIIEWMLEVNISIGKKLCNIIARIEGEKYAITNKDIDLRTAPSSIKYGIIHNEVVLSERWNLCNSCEFLTEDTRCQKCNCYMKVKHQLAYADCPIGKWGKYTEGALSGTTVTS